MVDAAATETLDAVDAVPEMLALIFEPEVSQQIAAAADFVS